VSTVSGFRDKSNGEKISTPPNDQHYRISPNSRHAPRHDMRQFHDPAEAIRRRDKEWKSIGDVTRPTNIHGAPKKSRSTKRFIIRSFYFASPQRVARNYCVCLSFVCPLAYLENHTAKLHQFCARCLWLWLGSPLTALRYGLWMMSCFQTVNSESVTAETSASIPTKFRPTIKIDKCT